MDDLHKNLQLQKHSPEPIDSAYQWALLLSRCCLVVGDTLFSLLVFFVFGLVFFAPLPLCDSSQSPQPWRGISKSELHLFNVILIILKARLSASQDKESS